ncbi:hypothetical protein Unana1_04764 [Umbelopsis nana]
MSSNFIRQVPEATRNLTVQNLAYQQLKHNGNGIRIGIIDSGVDYLHPALGGCFGPNCKARYGYNLVGDDYTGDIATLKPDDDPMDSCGAGSEGTGHGTHVSGIIAADDEQLNWTGVAPGPIIGMWRVFSCHKIVAPNDILIKTMEMAYEAKLDIINLSRGENGGWAEDPLSIIADRIVDAGVYVVVASGDAGANGIFLTAAPASDRKVIATGSVDNLHVKGLPDGLIGTGGLGGGSISSFSRLGPTNDLELKPDVSAVGGFVFSTVPRYLGGYGTISGTSMSSPWVAGSIALLLGYNKTFTPQAVTNAIMNFAEPVTVRIANHIILDSPIRQGAGVANIVSAIRGIRTLAVNPPKLSFNDTTMEPW